MSETEDTSAKLRAALERLAKIEEDWGQTPEGQAARNVTATRPDDVIAALMAEVGDTVLPARVILSGASEQLSLAVAGRRVQGLLSASDGVLGGHGDLIDTVLDAEEDAPIAALRSVIDAIAKSDGPFTLRTEAAPRLGSENEPGLNPAQLKATKAVAAHDQSALETFLREVEPVIRGGILTKDDEIVLRVGDETLAEPLVDVLEAAWPDFEVERKKTARDHSDPSLTCWQQTDGPVVAVANWADSGIAALAFLPESIPDVLSMWSTALKA